MDSRIHGEAAARLLGLFFVPEWLCRALTGRTARPQLRQKGRAARRVRQYGPLPACAKAARLEPSHKREGLRPGHPQVRTDAGVPATASLLVLAQALLLALTRCWMAHLPLLGRLAAPQTRFLRRITTAQALSALRAKLYPHALLPPNENGLAGATSRHC